MNKHRIRNRLEGYGYTRDGWYFVTNCVQDGFYAFGNVIDNKMFLNEYGKIV